MREEKRACLFIGGPWDGRRVVVDASQPIIQVHPREDSSAALVDAASGGDQPQRLAMYRRAPLRAPGREWVVFAAEDVADGEVIARLIEGYGVVASPGALNSIAQPKKQA